MTHLLHEKYIGDLNEHVVLGRFAQGSLLLVAGTCDRLSVYRMSGGTLERIKEKRVYGHILGLSLLPDAGPELETDAFIVHFEHARFSTVFYNEKENEITSSTLRCYEKKEFRSTLESKRAAVRVDEEHGMVLGLVSSTHFVLCSGRSLGREKVYRIREVQKRYSTVIDAVFLLGYTGPTLCFLFQDLATEKFKTVIYTVDEKELSLSLFFEVDSVPPGCDQIVPAGDRAFCVLGPNGALFYTQWEMLGARFNTFWDLECFGITEIPMEGRPFVLEKAVAVSKGRDIFVFAQDVHLHFSILGGEGRITRVRAQHSVSPGIPLDAPLDSAAYENTACVSTVGGTYVLECVQNEDVLETEQDIEQAGVVREFSEVFLAHLESEEKETAGRNNPREKGEGTSSTNTQPGSKHKTSLASTPPFTMPDSLAREFAYLFQIPAESSPSRKKNWAFLSHTLRLHCAKPSIGLIRDTVITEYSPGKREYVSTCGTEKSPLIAEFHEGIEFVFVQKAKLRGCTEIFSLCPEQRLYLATSRNGSMIFQWAGKSRIEKVVHAEIDDASRTLQVFRGDKEYVQITQTSIVYLSPSLRRRDRVSLSGDPAVQAQCCREDRVFVLTSRNQVWEYTREGRKRRKTVLDIQNVQCIALSGNSLYCATASGELCIWSIEERVSAFASHILHLLPAVLENLAPESSPELRSVSASLQKTFRGAGRIAVELAVVHHRGSEWIFVRSADNEIAVYRKHGGAYIKEKVRSNGLYIERSGSFVRREMKRMKVCSNLVIVPGFVHSRMFCITSSGVYAHRIHTPIESIEEVSRPPCICPQKMRPQKSPCPSCLERTVREFDVYAKGNLARGTLSLYAYDRELPCRAVRVDAPCEKISHCAERGIFVVSSYRKVDYTQDMMPFTVLSTTELDAEKLPPPDIPPVDICPQTREYSLAIYSHREMKSLDKHGILLSVDRYVLQPNEYVSHHKMLQLEDKQSPGGISEFLVVCTTYVTDEDLIASGRLIVFEVADVVPEKGRRETKHKLKALAAEKTKGATTACDAVRGNIIAAVGTKIMAYSFDRNDGLLPTAFFDMQIFLTSCAVLRNIVVFSDAYKGVFLFFFQRDPPLLHLLGHSATHVSTLEGVGLSFQDGSLGILSYDGRSNAYIHSYSPQHMLSERSSRLISRSECRLPDRVAAVRMGISVGSCRTHLFTEHGYIYVHGIVEDTRYAQLLDIQTAIISTIRMTCGTAPESHWMVEKGKSKEVTVKDPLLSAVAEEFNEMSVCRQSLVCAETGRASPESVKGELQYHALG